MTKLSEMPPVALAIAAVGLMAFDVPEGEWPQWRGPQRDGVVRAFGEPQAWPEELKLVWKRAVGSGYSSPVVSGQRVYLFTRQEEREVVSCLDLKNGETWWRQDYPAPYRLNPAARAHGKGPKSTPVLYRGKLFTFGIGGILSCFHARSGELRWRQEFDHRFPDTTPLYGVGMSAAAEDGVLIAHVGGHDHGALTAFSADTGKVLWSWDGDGPAYASPIIAELAGVRQVVTQTQENLVGIRFSTGELLWSIPFTTPYTQNIVTPVVHGEKLIFSGLDKGILAIRLVRRGSALATEEVWKNRRLSLYMSSPVLVGDWLFGLSHLRKGQFFCLDARTGATRWVSRGRQAENAAVIRLGEVLLLLTNDADLIVLPTTADAFRPVARYAVADSPTWAHPVVVNGGVLIKGDSFLALWSFE
ncbi:MAG: PQQ-binding-like beta-propeller repeat protein [Acidobacteriota bacterium]